MHRCRTHQLRIRCYHFQYIVGDQGRCERYTMVVKPGSPLMLALRQASIASIIQVGEYFFCGHPAGIFRSSDKGKTWKMLLPSIENNVFNLSVSGNVIWAISSDGDVEN
jgi:hypothetical protein